MLVNHTNNALRESFYCSPALKDGNHERRGCPWHSKNLIEDGTIFRRKSIWNHRLLQGLCVTCLDGCEGVCEVGRSAVQGTDMLYPTFVRVGGDGIGQGISLLIFRTSIFKEHVPAGSESMLNRKISGFLLLIAAQR